MEKKINYSKVEYVVVDDAQKEIMCAINIGSKYEKNKFTSEELPGIPYSKEKYDEIVMKMKKIIKIDEVKTKKNEEVVALKVNYANNSEAKFFPIKCRQTLEDLLKKHTEILKMKKEKTNAALLTAGIWGVGVAFLAGLTYCGIKLVKESIYNHKNIDFKDPNETEEQYEDEIELNADKLYDELVAKQNRIVDKEVLSNIIMGLNGNYNFIKYVGNEEIALNEEESKTMIDKVLNELATITDNNMEKESKVVNLSNYILNEDGKNISRKLEDKVQELKNEYDHPTNENKFDELKAELLKSSVDIMGGDIYKGLDSLVKVYSSITSDQAIAKWFNGTERYERENNGEVKTYFYKYYVNDNNQAILPIKIDSYGNLMFYDLNGTRYSTTQVMNFDEKGQGKYLNDVRQLAVFGFENDVLFAKENIEEKCNEENQAIKLN